MSLNEASTKITDGGRIVIPSLYRQKLGLDIGDEVILLLENGEIRILSRQAASDRARASSSLCKREKFSRRINQRA